MFAKAFMKKFLAALLIVGATTTITRAQDARQILSTLPDSQAVIYVNTQRIFNEAMPRVVPQAELDKMFADVQSKIGGFDLRSIHFVALGGRIKETPGMPPDFFVLAKGDFNIDALLSMARMATEGARTQETYKGRTIDIFNLAAMNKKPAAAQGGGQQTPAPPPPISEIAVVILDANTFVAGIPSYVRAAVDARESEQGRISASLLDLATRNPDNLFSLASDIPPSLPALLRSVGMPQNAEIDRIISSLRQVQTSISMTGENFGMQSIIRTDTADNARAVNGMITMGLSFARMGIEEQLKKVPADKPGEREAMQTVLNLISSLTNKTQDTEVQVDLVVPQQTVATFVQKEMARQKAAAAAKAAKPAPKPTPRGRRSRRRT